MRLPGAFVVLALVCGGAGTDYPLNQLALELSAILLICRWALTAPAVREPGFRAIVGLFVAALALLALQLVPLPPSLWHALPGRTTAARIYQAIGWDRRWHAASLTPDATFADLLALLPPLAAFLTVAALSARKRMILLRIVVGMALLGTLFAALQVAVGGQSAPVLFETSHRGYGVGFFVNRNHQATFLLVGIVLAAVPGVIAWGKDGRDRRSRRPVILALLAFLALGVLATTSRTGLVLLPLALIVAVALLLEPGRALAYVAGCALLYGLAAAALFPTPLAQRTLERFSTAAEDLRYQYWDNSRYAIGRSLPWGTGFGSFDAVYRSVEPLAQVAPFSVNHAHNDYLEVALEGGVPALVLIAAGLAVALFAFVLAWRRAASRAERSGILGASAGVVLILLFSLVDYPLRMAAIAVLFGLLLGLAVPPPARTRPGGNAAPSPARPSARIAVALAGVLAGWFVLTGGLAAALAGGGAPAVAARVAPWSAEAWSQLADAEQVSGRPAASAAAAERALAISPIDAGAVRALGYARIAQGDPAAGVALLQIDAALGWRDMAAQVWLVQRALAVGDLRRAVERIDGLMRRGLMTGILMRQLREIFLYPGGSDALAERLAERPPWRQGFLNMIADDSPRAVPQILALLHGVRARGAPADGRETALIRWRLADAGNYAAAASVWRRSGGRGLIADGAFGIASGIVPAGAPPYAWRAPGSSGTQVSVVEADSGGGRRSVVIASDGFATGPVLAQTVVLPAGSYRLGVSLLAGAWNGVSPMTWSLSCLPSGVRQEVVAIPLGWPAAVRGPARATGRFAIPQGCPAWSLELSLKESSGEPFSLRLDQVVVEQR